MRDKQKNDLATQLFAQKKFKEAFAIADDLIKGGYPPALTLRGLISEFRSDGEEDLEAALRDYTEASFVLRNDEIDLHLARINMKLGNFAKARHYAESALQHRIFPEAWMLAGDIYSRPYANGNDEVRDLELAAGYYFRACMRGRLKAMIRYREIQEKLGNKGKWIFAGVLLSVLGPVSRFLLGRRAYYSY